MAVGYITYGFVPGMVGVKGGRKIHQSAEFDGVSQPVKVFMERIISAIP